MHRSTLRYIDIAVMADIAVSLYIDIILYRYTYKPILVYIVSHCIFVY